jgi:hypothetical protein
LFIVSLLGSYFLSFGPARSLLRLKTAKPNELTTPL